MTSPTSGSTRIRHFISKFPASCDKHLTLKIQVLWDVWLRHWVRSRRAFRRVIAPSFSRSNRTRIILPVPLDPADKALRSFPTADGPLTQRHSVTTTTAVNSLTACIFILECFPSSLAAPKFGAKSSVHKNSRRHTLFKTPSFKIPKRETTQARKTAQSSGGGGIWRQ